MSANYGCPANDEWQTTARTWASLAPAIERYRTKRIWMPFYYDGACAEHLRALGFEDVVHEADVDFFERVQDTAFMRTVDVIIDNPPYTNREIKERVLRALAQCGKPFVLLLPISTLHVAFVREALDMSAVQAIVPRRVHVRKSSGPELPFKYLVWLCYRTAFERDLSFLEEPDSGPDDDDADE
ncbi:hypothetical protein T492DRAFT_602446 [Pavlovales sp. CCMP2436]|nr:hypothetical protein T492DRAFT_602446 [Pavlovales sp. CCMP2436]